MYRRLIAYIAPVLAFALPIVASAHEVYVLSPGDIASDTAAAPFDMLGTAIGNLHQFLFWAFVGFVLVSTVFFASIFHFFEQTIDPLLARGKRYAHDICRYTVGIGLIAGAYYQATYGPELPLAATYGALTPFVTALIVLIGLMMIAGIYVRIAALIALAFFSVAVFFHGTYMLTYTNYLGEFLVLLILGSSSKRARMASATLRRIAHAFAPYSFAVIRVCFGISFLYASLYAKILHNNLALAVADSPLAGHAHGLAYYFGFEPHFMVLGAAIIEIVIAVFFIIGLEIRWTCLFLEFWLALSLWWFGESVWPHLILIGLPIAIFLHGYDRYSLEGLFFKKGRLEPVL